jgi:transcriptional antiterminator RfaH
MKQWYVVHTHARQEVRAEVNLRRQGYEAWLPFMKRARRQARSGNTWVPLVSVSFRSIGSTSQPWRSINGTFGVVLLLCDAIRPVVVPADLMEKMMEGATSRARYRVAATPGRRRARKDCDGPLRS